MISDTFLSRGTFNRTHFATITGVNEKLGTVSIIFNDQFGFRDDVPIPVVAMSRNAWIRFMPQINDVVHVGFRGDDSAAILGWHSWAYRARTEGFEKNELNQAGGAGPEMMQSLKPGELDIRASGGGYLRMNNIGDVLLMGLSGRIQFFGIESLIEHSQNAFKATDGLSWLRFGHAYRSFPGVSERELPTTGSGQPNNGPTPIRELDVRLFDANGKLLVQESLGSVVDTDGVAEVSGTTGNGTTTKVQVQDSGDEAKSFFKGDINAVRNQFTQSLGEIPDQVVSFANETINSIKTGINTVINGIGGSLDGITSTATDLANIIKGTGPIGGDAGKLSGIGPIGRTLRRRFLVNRDGEQVFAQDVDDKGGVTFTSDSDDGVRFNTNEGGFTFFAKKAIELLAKGVVVVAENITESAKKDIKQIAAGKIRRIAGTDVKDNGNTITRTAQTSISDKAGTSITQNSDGSITIQAGTSLSESGTTVTISATGIVTITGAQVLIN